MSGAVARVRHTPPQAALSRRARFKNLKGAFEPTEAGRRAVAGRRVLLVDDVMTTGATCSAAARAMRDAGADFVGAAVPVRAVI